MRGSNTGPKKEMETKYWSDCRARLNFIIYSIVRENGRERWAGGGSESDREKESERKELRGFLKKNK